MEQEWEDGTILILILSLFCNVEQHTAQASNLIFFIPTSFSAIIAISKDKLIDFKLGIKIIIFGIVGTIIGSIISINMEVYILKKCFGVFLGTVTIFEIYSIIKEHKKNKIGR